MHLLRAISELKAPNLVSLHGCPRLLSGPPLRNIENRTRCLYKCYLISCGIHYIY